jgi:repressor LexA
MALTARQSVALDFIVSFIKEHKYSPSYEEIGAGMGLKSLATVNQFVKKLQRKGLIEVEAFKSRSIRVRHDLCPHCFRPKKV